MPEDIKRPWYEELSDEDIAFIKRLVLASGSLKDLAKAYDVSYPTIRLRLDRLIAKVQILDEHRELSDFERQLNLLYADGRLDELTFSVILDAHMKEEAK